MRPRVLRALAAVGALLVILATTAPWSGVIRCADGMTSSSCTSNWYSFTGADAWDLAPSVSLGLVAAAVTWVIVLAVQRRRTRRPV